MKKIMLPIDRSTNSQESFSSAKEYAQKLDAKLVIVQVIEMHQNLHNIGYATMLLPDSDFFEKESNEILDKAKSYFDDTDLEVETKILWGSPAEQIIKYSEEENFDLIIMCTHGMSASKRFLMGSTTSKVVNYAQVPVMVIK